MRESFILPPNCATLTYWLLFQRRQHFFRVSFHVHFGKDFLYIAVAADHERGPVNAGDFVAVEVLFLQHTVGFGDLALHVAQKGKRQPVFLLEFFLDAGSIGAHAKHRHTELLKLWEGIAEPASLRDSARRIGPGKEIQHERLALKILQANRLVLLIGQFKIRGRLSFLQHGFLLLFATETQRWDELLNSKF